MKADTPAQAAIDRGPLDSGYPHPITLDNGDPQMLAKAQRFGEELQAFEATEEVRRAAIDNDGYVAPFVHVHPSYELGLLQSRANCPHPAGFHDNDDFSMTPADARTRLAITQEENRRIAERQGAATS
jgi:hypothetical protein